MEQNAISSDLIRGHIDTIILHTLLDGDKFAQQISDAVEIKSGNAYKLNQATLYSSLKRLESLRYVKSYWNDSNNGRRKYFNLTETGKEFAENNLLNWSKSRTIIDKLMDCEQNVEEKVVYKTQFVEKIVEVPIKTEVSPAVSIVSKEDSTVQPVEKTEKNDDFIAEKSTVNSVDTAQDVNFRSILNSLIKNTNVKINPTPNEELQPLDKIETNIDEEKQKFNETISSIDLNVQKSNTGKVDFGDLTIKAAKEGYKIRISSKDSCVAKGTLLTNKLNLFTSLFAFLLAEIMLLAITLTSGANPMVIKLVAIIGSVIFSVSPLICLIKYLLNPKNSSPITIKNDVILTAIIIVFNVLVVTLALNLILKVDFTNYSLIAFTLVLPVLLSMCFIGTFILKVVLSKMPQFKVGFKNN